MKITEKDRLDLRQELERVFQNKRFADIAMEAMPPIDYQRLATKDDLDALGASLRSETAELRAQITLVNGELQLKMANQMRMLLMSQGATIAIVGSIVAAT